MAKCLVILLYFFTIGTVAAQPGWSYLPPVSPHNNETYALATNATKDKIVLCTVGFDTLLKQSLIFTELDSFGTILKQVFVQDSTGSISNAEWWGGMISCADGGYLATASTAEKKQNMLIKLDSELNVEFVFNGSQDTSLVSEFDFTPIEFDGAFYVFGSIRKNGQPYSDSAIRKFDFNGNLIWERQLSYVPFSERVIDLTIWNDTILVAATVENLIQGNVSTPSQGRSGLFKIDSRTGSVQEEWHSTIFPSIGYSRKIMKTNSNTLLFYGLAVQNIVGTDVYARKVLTVMDENFAVIAQDSFGLTSLIGSASEIKEWLHTKDGNILAVTGGMPANRLGGKVFKLSLDSLKTIWGTTVYSPLVPSYAEFSYLYDLDTLASGNIIAAGVANDTFSRDTWVVKITKDGCFDTLWCQTSLLPNLPVPEQQVLSVYPNPASHTINLTHPDLFGTGHIQVFGVSGNLVLESQIHQATSHLDVSSLDDGLYFIIFETEAGISMTKLIIHQSD